MISRIIAETGEQLAAYERYEKDKGIQQKVEATQERLADLRQAVAAFANDFRQVTDILEPEKRQYIQETGKGLLEQLVNSRSDFVEQQQTNQASSLSSIVLSLNNLRRQLQSVWGIYAEAQIKPRRELYNLISSLPEVARHKADINSLFERLKKDAESFPASRSARHNFQDRLEQLDRYLDIHRGLPIAVRQFLEQVRENRATVVDLDDEILAWCREGNRGRVFKITF